MRAAARIAFAALAADGEQPDETRAEASKETRADSVGGAPPAASRPALQARAEAAAGCEWRLRQTSNLNAAVAPRVVRPKRNDRAPTGAGARPCPAGRRTRPVPVPDSDGKPPRAPVPAAPAGANK